MAHDAPTQPTDEPSDETPNASGTEVGADVPECNAPEAGICEAVNTTEQRKPSARLALWKLVAKRKFGRLFTKMADEAPSADDTEDADPNRPPTATTAKRWTRCRDFVKSHQVLFAVLLVSGFAVGLYFSAWNSPETEDGKSSADNAPLTFDDVDVLPPEEVATREPANVREFDQAQPIQTAEHESGPEFGNSPFEDGPSLSGPALGSASRKPAGRDAWLTGTIEDVTETPSNIRRIGHVDLPASKSSTTRR